MEFENIVQISENYGYKTLERNLDDLKKQFPIMQIGNIGKSVLGKNLYFVKLGIGKNKVFYNAAIHANEWITAPLLMKFIENYLIAYTENLSIYNVNIRALYNTSSIYIVPMCNPDGVDLVTGNININSSLYTNTEYIANFYPNIPFPIGWKANIKGVDLNLQFPAGWENAKKIKYKRGFTSPAPRDFVGYGPLTEPESLALFNFTNNNKFNLTISYHTQGEEIYYEFQGYSPKGSIEFGQKFAKASGYILTTVPYNSSFAGYKDWFIQDFNKPGFTIEAGSGKNPLPISQFNEIYNDNIGIFISGAS